MGKKQKAQITYIHIFLGAGRALGIRDSVWNGCKMSEPVSVSQPVFILQSAVAVEAGQIPSAKNR